MADKGLVSKNILQGYADEARRLTESNITGTPAEILSILRGVEAGSEATVLTGVYTCTSSTGRTVPTGVALPGEDYVFVVANVGYYTNGAHHTMSAFKGLIRIAYVTYIAGVKTSVTCSYGISQMSAEITIDQTTGLVTLPSGVTAQNSYQYHWVFVGGKLS